MALNVGEPPRPPRMGRLTITGGALLVALGGAPADLLAQGQPLVQLRPTDVAERATPATVVILGTDEQGNETSGSGFVIAPTGVIVTSLHVLRNLRSALVQLSNGDVYDHIVVTAFDERKDIAILRIPAVDLPILELGDSETIRVGEEVVLIGSPLGLSGTVSTGIVSAIRSFPRVFASFRLTRRLTPATVVGL